MNRLIVRYILPLFATILVSFDSAIGQTFVFAELNGNPTINTTGWNLTGNAQIGNTNGTPDANLNELILTSNLNGQSGGIFWNQPIDLNVCTQWIAEFDFRIFDGNGADGLAFCFLDVPPAGFVAGGGVGIPGASNGLKIVIDTYDNCGGPNPEIQIFNGVGYNECGVGIIKLDNSGGTLNFIRSNDYRNARIVYNAGNIQVFINNTLYLTGFAPVNFTGYMGFTASTGGLNDSHSIRNVIIYTSQATSDAGQDAAICSGETVQIGSTPNPDYLYSWSPTTGLNNATIANPLVTLTSSTVQQFTYTVSTTLASNPGACPTTDDVVITVFPEQITQLEESICEGESFLFQGTLVDQPGVYTSTLQSQHGCDSTLQLTLTVNPQFQTNLVATLCQGDSYQFGNQFYNQTGVYQELFTSIKGCDSLVTLNLSIIDVQPPDLQGFDEYCISEGTVTLWASGTAGVQFNWYTDPTLQNLVFTGSNLVLPAQTGNYTLYVTEFSGNCESTPSLGTFNVHPLPNISAGSDSQLCEGQPVILTGQGGVSYTWNQGVTNGQPFVQQVGSVTYTVTGTDANGCVNTDQVVVTVNPLPNTSFTLLNNKGCAPLEPTFINTTPGNNQQNCTWNFGNGTTGSGCLTTSAIYSTSGCYNVTLAVTSNQGCTQSFTLNDIVCVDEQPVAQFAANPLTMSTIHPEVTVINLSENAVTYQWEFGDNSGQYSQESLAHTYEEAGVYIISLHAYSENGCVDSTFQTVIVEEELLFFIPNAFTPGGDKFNETFQPVFTSGFDPYRFNMVLFNRWGEIVFETNNAAIGWDGTYGGKPAPEGTYIWQVKLDNVTFDKPQIYRGHFSLLR